MSGKTQNKKELQKENNEIKKELSDVKNHYSNLLEEYRTLESKTTSSFKCSRCEKSLESFQIVNKPQEDHDFTKEIFECDHCEKEFNENWKLNAHLKVCKVKRCDVCDKTFKYTDLLKKHKLIAHENFKIYCHFFNNGKSCPNRECVFLHEESTMCKYDSVCERLYCMFKHGKEKKSLVDETGVLEENNVDKKHEDSEEEMTGESTNDKQEECDEIVIVDVEIVNDLKISESVEIISKKDTVQENNVDDTHDDVEVELDKVRIVDVEDDIIENRTGDDKEEASDDNIELVKKLQKEPPITDRIAGSFVCNICNFAATSKHELVSHKVSTHNWCIKCFSTFDSREKLKNHLSTKHKSK